VSSTIDQAALTTATMGLRSSVRTEIPGQRPEVWQRLEQLMTIVSKPHCEPEMTLTRMQGIGGC
jgi:hypothetical protein